MLTPTLPPLPRLQSYERLEFLGDGVLTLTTRSLLMERRPSSDEVGAAWRQPAAGLCPGGAPAPSQASPWRSPVRTHSRQASPPATQSHVRGRRRAVQPMRRLHLTLCAACLQGEMTKLQGLLVSGVAVARYAEWLGLERFVVLEAKAMRCVGAAACPTLCRACRKRVACCWWSWGGVGWGGVGWQCLLVVGKESTVVRGAVGCRLKAGQESPARLVLPPPPPPPSVCCAAAAGLILLHHPLAVQRGGAAHAWRFGRLL